MPNSNAVVENYKINTTSQKITDLDLNLDVDYDNLKVNGKNASGGKKLYISLENGYIQNVNSTYIGPIIIYDGTDLYSYVGTPSN